MITIVRQRQWYNHKKNRWRQMTVMAFRITCQSSVCSTICLDRQQRKITGPCYWHFATGIHQWPVSFPQKWTVTWNIFPFDDVIIHTVRIFDEAYCMQTCCNIHAYVYDIPPQLRLRSCEISFVHNIFHMWSFVWKLCSDDGSDIFVL